MKIDDKLESVVAWAEERLRNGAEPPFIYYRLMQLREAAEELLPHARQLAGDSPGLAAHHETALQQADQGAPPKIVPLYDIVNP